MSWGEWILLPPFRKGDRGGFWSVPKGLESDFHREPTTAAETKSNRKRTRRKQCSKLNLTSKKSLYVNLPSAGHGKRASPNARSPRSSAKRFMDYSSAPWWKGTILFPTKVTKPAATTPDPRRCVISSVES